MRQRGCWPGDGSGIRFRAAARTRGPPPVQAGPGEPPPSSPATGPPTRPATCARTAPARMSGDVGHFRRGVRGPLCACRASWHRVCPSALCVNRDQHADDVLDADTPLSGRPSTVRNRRGNGQMTPPRLHGTNVGRCHRRRPLCRTLNWLQPAEPVEQVSGKDIPCTPFDHVCD